MKVLLSQGCFEIVLSVSIQMRNFFSENGPFGQNGGNCFIHVDE